MKQDTGHAVHAWFFQDMLLEHYRYAPGPAGSDTPHAHDAYQLCLSVNHPGLYTYRGASHAVPAASLSIIHPGEMHASRDHDVRETTTVFRLMYVPLESLHRIASTIAGHVVSQPFFSSPIVLHRQLVRQFLDAHRSCEIGMSRLEQDSKLVSLFTSLVVRHAQERPAIRVIPAARPELARVRDYLHTHYAAPVSLQTLAEVAGFSSYHLCRLFSQEFGVPPHVYQNQVRIDHAKRLLAQGQSSVIVANATGFYDQSHFGRYFKRFIGISPRQYAAR